MEQKKTSRRPLPIYFLPFAPSRGVGTCGVRFYPNGRCYAIIGPGYHAGRLEELLASTGLAGPEKMSRTQSCPVHTGSNGGTGKLLDRRYKIWLNIGVMWFVDENEAVNRISRLSAEIPSC